MLESENIVLTALKKEDSPILFEWINDRDLVHYNGPYTPVHESQHQAWFESLKNRDNEYIFAIRLKEGDQLIGSCKLINLNSIHSHAELQIRIGAKGMQGKGYGVEAVKLLLEFAFKELNLHRIWLEVFTTNERAIKAYEKCGFQREGVLRDGIHINGEYIDSIIMGILRSEFVK